MTEAGSNWNIHNIVAYLPDIPRVSMEQRGPPEFILEAFADPASVKEVVKGILHTIFFHRYFPLITPQTRPVLSLSLPYIDDVELETLIEQRAALLERQLDAERNIVAQQHHSPIPGSPALGGTGIGATGTQGGGGRGQITVKFSERKRRKAWIVRGEEEVCWECWTVKVTVAEPKTENERAKVRQAMEQTLLAAVRKIMKYVNANKDHIPPITATSGNPFPYQINVNQKEAGWAARMGIY
ncbi:hypothetical protein jhhlp_004601 [Lomentospora prolificans]|uniref:Autophagy-related protein 101 n=1 Tax=Lomentospora prolificans TaxID=41688 RepID=A0A2N3NC53_9PEZI|nr:hypothetical protein jhhlp_004601 [Lomentospora prolificans]